MHQRTGSSANQGSVFVRALETKGSPQIHLSNTSCQNIASFVSLSSNVLAGGNTQRCTLERDSFANTTTSSSDLPTVLSKTKVERESGAKRKAEWKKAWLVEEILEFQSASYFRRQRGRSVRRHWTDHHKATTSFLWNADVDELKDWLRQAREFEDAKVKPEVKHRPEKRAIIENIPIADSTFVDAAAGVNSHAIIPLDLPTTEPENNVFVVGLPGTSRLKTIEAERPEDRQCTPAESPNRTMSRRSHPSGKSPSPTPPQNKDSSERIQKGKAIAKQKEKAERESRDEAVVRLSIVHDQNKAEHKREPEKSVSSNQNQMPPQQTKIIAQTAETNDAEHARLKQIASVSHKRTKNKTKSHAARLVTESEGHVLVALRQVEHAELQAQMRLWYLREEANHETKLRAFEAEADKRHEKTTSSKQNTRNTLFENSEEGEAALVAAECARLHEIACESLRRTFKEIESQNSTAEVAEIVGHRLAALEAERSKRKANQRLAQKQTETVKSENAIDDSALSGVQPLEIICKRFEEAKLHAERDRSSNAKRDAAIAPTKSRSRHLMRFS